MTRSRRALTLLSALALATGCAGAPEETTAAEPGGGYPVTVASCGVTSTVQARPTRAVTISQGATEVALALGVQDQIVGTAYLDDAVPEKWKAAFESIPVMAKEYPDQETLLSAEPDFVYAAYASAFGKDGVGTQAELGELGVPTLLSLFGCDDGDKPSDGEPVSFETVWKEIDIVADVFGVPGRAETIRQQQVEQLAVLEKDSVGKGLEVFWYDSGDKTPYTGTGQGGPQLILDAVGATNEFAHIGNGWTDVPWELVVKADPDVIVLADASWSTAAEKISYLRKDPVLSRLRAVQAESFATLPFSETTPGVRLADGATHLAEQLTALATR